MKEQIEKALAEKDFDGARKICREWFTALITQYGFGIPEELQREQGALATLVERGASEVAAEKALAERKSKWMVQDTLWDNKDGSRSRRARLLVRSPDGRLYWFLGSSLEGVTVATSKFVKDGKWSHTVYRLNVQSGFAVIPMRDGFDSNTILGGLGKSVGLSEMSTASEIADVLEVPQEEVEKLLV